jgi:hypothetical protein
LPLGVGVADGDPPKIPPPEGRELVVGAGVDGRLPPDE